jgi:hypothetical protein
MKMAVGAVNIPTMGVDELREVVRKHEAKLAAAERQRCVILIDMRKASSDSNIGDKRATIALTALRKSEAAADRLVRSAETQVFEAKKRLQMALNQQAVIEAKKASIDAAAVALPKDKWFLVTCPDGREVRHRHNSLDALCRELTQGYRPIAQKLGVPVVDRVYVTVYNIALLGSITGVAKAGGRWSPAPAMAMTGVGFGSACDTLGSSARGWLLGWDANRGLPARPND